MTYDMTSHTHNGLIDLRSDTVTFPSPSMRKAMYEAELGDDTYAEDPTVNRLQELSAQRLGKEAGLLVLSGTMGNLVSMLTHCGRGDEAIMGIGRTRLQASRAAPRDWAGYIRTRSRRRAMAR